MTGFLTIIGIWFLSLNDSVLRRDGQRTAQGDVVPIPSSGEDRTDPIEAA